MRSEEELDDASRTLHLDPEKSSGDSSDKDVGAKFDELLLTVGAFGRYQQIIVFLVLLPAIFGYSYANGFWLFVIATPEKFYCRTSAAPVPLYTEGDQQCEVTRLVDSWNGSDLSNLFQQNLTAPCDGGWVYDQTSYYSTIVTEWDLVCSRDFLATLAYIAFSIVGTLAAPLGGWCSDHYGRKRTYFVFLLIEIISGIAVAFSPSYWFFLVFACIHSIAVYPTYQALYTLGLEMLNPQYRTTFAVLLGFAYAMGAMACCGVAFLVREWRTLILASTVPVAALLGLWWIMPESPRFNLSQRKYHKVERYFRRAAKWNHKDFGVESREKCGDLFQTVTLHDTKKERKSYSFKDLFTHPGLCRRTFLLMLLSTLVAVSYYGLAYYAPQFGTNPYLNVFLTCVVDLPAAFLTQLVADKLGRRLTLVMDFLLGGLVCLATLCFPQTDDFYYVTLVLFLLARMFAVSSYTMEELVSCENFPTSLRGEGISLTNGVSGVVSNLGPLIVYFSSGNDTPTPMAWFGAITVLGCFVMLFIPETANKPLPETMEDFQEYTVLRSWREFLSPLAAKPTDRSHGPG